MNKTHPARWRNIAIFTILVLGIGTFAGVSSQALDGLGGLLFILSPLLVTLGLRSFSDGWSDVGLALKLRHNWPTIITALILFPLVFCVTLGTGHLIGAVHFQSGWGSTILTGVIMSAPAVIVFVFSEEFAWRGYLEPKLAALGVPGLKRHLIVAFVWGLWHIGYIFSQPEFSQIPIRVFLPLFLASMIPMAVIYGVWRSRSGSMWPAFVAHGCANMLIWPLRDPLLVNIDTPLWFEAGPAGLGVLGLLSVIAFLIWWQSGETPEQS
jgi:membrane protease YdiL (CAAX protease family)